MPDKTEYQIAREGTGYSIVDREKSSKVLNYMDCINAGNVPADRVLKEIDTSDWGEKK